MTRSGRTAGDGDVILCGPHRGRKRPGPEVSDEEEDGDDYEMDVDMKPLKGIKQEHHAEHLDDGIRRRIDHEYHVFMNGRGNIDHSLKASVARGNGNHFNNDKPM